MSDLDYLKLRSTRTPEPINDERLAQLWRRLIPDPIADRGPLGVSIYELHDLLAALEAERQHISEALETMRIMRAEHFGKLEDFHQLPAKQCVACQAYSRRFDWEPAE